MKRIIRKAMLLGMGITSLTKEKIEKFVKELEREGKVSEKEGRKLVDDLVKDARKKQKELMKKLGKEADRVLDKSPLATKKDVKSLERKLKPPAKKKAAKKK